MATNCIARRAVWFADGEAVWSWRLDNSVTMLAHRTGDGDKKPDHQGEHGGNRYNHCAGSAGGGFGEPVVTNLCAF
jgi:hypothetical protein